MGRHMTTASRRREIPEPMMREIFLEAQEGLRRLTRLEAAGARRSDEGRSQSSDHAFLVFLHACHDRFHAGACFFGFSVQRSQAGP